ncbi:MAG: hypothetical protein J7K20_06160 [Thermodesulfobacterium sp.]|nr:hypothetical protein [Thermodesulfobacterium sp.]
MNKKNKVYVDPLNITFAKFMEITTYIGLIIMIIFGLLYLFGLPGFVNMKHAISHWNLPVNKFWEEVKGIRVYGYSWFLTNLTAMDCLSMVGICILALAPLAGLVSGVFKTKGQKLYTIFFIILTIEFLFAILKPIILPSVGGH